MDCLDKENENEFLFFPIYCTYIVLKDYRKYDLIVMEKGNYGTHLVNELVFAL